MRCTRVLFLLVSGLTVARGGVQVAAPPAKPASTTPTTSESPANAPAALTYASPDGAFAFTLPTGWTTKAEPGEQFPAIFGPGDGASAPYVVVKVIHDPKDPFELGDATIKVLTKNPGFQLNLRDAFRTTDKKFGLKFVLAVSVEKASEEPPAADAAGTAISKAAPAATSAVKTKPTLADTFLNPPAPVAGASAFPYRQAYYLIPGPPGIVYVILATVPDAGWKKYEAALDAMAESWREKQPRN